MELELLQDLKSYLGSDYDSNQEFLVVFCIKRAISSYKNQRNFPDCYTQEVIEQDMRKHYACIFDLVLYWCNMQGVEFQNSHSENSTSRSWMSESDIYTMHKIIPIGRII